MSDLVNKLQKQQLRDKHAMTACRKTGIKIVDHGNTYKDDPFAEANALLFHAQKAQRLQQKELAAPPAACQSADPTERKQAMADLYSNLDLNINNYNHAELLRLFGFAANKTSFDPDDLKDARKVMLRTHPDKSGLDMAVFTFFGMAYQRLLEMAEFQNKRVRQQQLEQEQRQGKVPQSNAQSAHAVEQLKQDRQVNPVSEQNQMLDRFFETFGKKSLQEAAPAAASAANMSTGSSSSCKTSGKNSNSKAKKNQTKPNEHEDKRAVEFNKWFNEAFEKHKVQDEATASGYGDWLQSEEDIVHFSGVTQANMKEKMDQHKRNVQSLIKYQGVETVYSGSRSNELMSYDSNFSSGGLFSGADLAFTDLRQAYVESVIPVTEEDFQKVRQYRNVDEYMRHRDESMLHYKPPTAEESMRELYSMNKQSEERSAALAFHLAKQTEEARKKQDEFWSSMKQLTNW